jgi:prephenate dehydrogenase
MGGSLALALHGRCARLTGVDHDPAVVALAGERGIVDLATPDLASGLRDCDLLVLATPVRTILALLAQLPTTNPHASRPISVLDLGSTKGAIARAMEALPAGFEPIGGHPMCGREVAGLEHAEAGIFAGHAFVLVPLANTTARTRGLARQLVRALGARAVEMAAAQHDRLTALASHLPYVAAAALVRAAQAQGDEQVWQVAASGFRDTSRLAASDLTMMVDILLTNRKAVLAALQGYQAELGELAALIEAGDPGALRAALEPARQRRSELFR